MDYGIVLPHFGSFARQEAAGRIVAVAETAESLGYSTAWVIDHLVLPAKVEGGYAFNPLDPFLEPITSSGRSRCGLHESNSERRYWFCHIGIRFTRPRLWQPLTCFPADA